MYSIRKLQGLGICKPYCIGEYVSRTFLFLAPATQVPCPRQSNSITNMRFIGNKRCPPFHSGILKASASWKERVLSDVKKAELIDYHEADRPFKPFKPI